MRRILGISMIQVKEDEIKNEETRKRFMNSKSFADIWRRKQMLFLGRITRLNICKYPFILLTASVYGKRSRGRPFWMVRDVFVDGIQSLMPNADEQGNTKDWIGYAKDKVT